jgi:8-oxo-dGTP diphosphatase
LPGGFLLFGESPLDGLRRELREELNVGISIERIVDAQVDTYGSRGEYSLNLFYKAHLISGIPQPSGEIREVEWFEIDRLPNLTYKSTQSVLSNLAQASA